MFSHQSSWSGVKEWGTRCRRSGRAPACRLGCVGFAVLLATASLRADDWTHFAGDAARHAVASDGPRQLVPHWSAGAAEQFVTGSAPAVWQGRAYVNARVFQNGVQVSNKVVAYALSTGASLWETPVDADIYASSSSAAVDVRNGTVLIPTGATLYALDAADGHIVWQTPLYADVVNASPAVSNDLTVGGTPANRVFITDFSLDAATLYALNVDPRDAQHNPYQPGAIAWTAPLPGASGNSPAYDAGRVVVTDTSGSIRAFDALSGAPLWSTPASSDGFFGGVCVVGGHVFAATYGFYGAENNSQLFKLDVTSGQIIWQAACERTDSIPIVTDDGRIFLSGGAVWSGSAVKVQAFRDLGNQAVMLWDTWQATGGTLTVGGWMYQPLFSHGLLYAGTPDPADFSAPYTDLYVLDTSRQPGTAGFIVAQHSGSGGCPALTGGVVYSFGRDGLFALGEPEPDRGGSSRAPAPHAAHRIVP